MGKGKKSLEQLAREKEFRRLRFEWLDQIAADPELPASAIRAAMFIALRHVNVESGLAWPSYAGLAEQLGNRERVAIAAVNILIERGHLVVAIQGRKGRGKANHYALVLKPENPPMDGGFSAQENLHCGGGFGNKENPHYGDRKTPTVVGMNHIEPSTPISPQSAGSGEACADHAPTDDAVIDALADQLLAILPRRPDSIPDTTPRLRREVARAIERGATPPGLIDGARRYRRYAAAKWNGTGLCEYAMSPEAWLRGDKWKAAWEVPIRLRRSARRDSDVESEREALLREMRGDA